jgi:hypothetical protein
MKTNARFITVSAVLMALTVVFAYLGSIFPAIRVAMIAVASLFTVAAVVEAGLGSAVLVYVGSALLGILLLPDKTAAFLYLLFFGFYPIVKSLSEGIKPQAVQWGVKIAVFYAAFTAVWFLFRALVFSAELLTSVTGAAALGLSLVYLIAGMAFILYDIGLTRLISFYIVRISKNLKKKV